MKQYLHRILVGALFLLSIAQANATHIVGADMSYKNIGGNTFEFSLNVFRDCEGIPVQPSYKIDYSSLSCNIQGNFTVVMDQSLTREVSPICPGLPTICTGGTQDGIQQYVFKGTFTLPQTCSDWIFSWRECNRNGDITTIVNPDAQCLYIETRLNSILAPTNSSPTFNNAPVSIMCTGQVNSVNPGAAEIDGDSMVFSAVTPKTGKSQNVTYLAPYSAGSPLTTAGGYQVSSVTGDIVVNPTVVDEITPVALLLQEYRNGQLIGSTLRDIQIITKNCNNNNPLLSGIDKTTADTKNVCAGSQVCFEIFGSDLDAGQKLSMSWDNAIIGATFTVSGDSLTPKGRFCWTTSTADVGLHFFTVTIKDDFCPLSGFSTKAYKINVTPAPIITITSPINIACNTTTTITPAISGGTTPYLYKWNTGETTPTITKGAGNYTLVITDSKGCKANQQVQVNSGVIPNFTMTKVCSTRTVDFMDASVSLAGTIVSRNWDFGEPSSGVANTSTATNPSHTYSSGGIFDVKLVVMDNTGCKDSIVKKVKMCDFPVANFITLDSCQSKPYIYIVDKSTASICGLVKIEYTFGTISGSFNSPPSPVYFPQSLIFPVIQPDTGWFNLTYKITNEDGCESTISKMVHVNQKPKISILESSYYFDCSNPSKLLHAVVDPTKGHPPFTVIWDDGTVGLTRTVNAPGVYSATVSDAYGCVDAAAIEVFDPLMPAFGNSPYCEIGDQVTFTESVFSHWGAARWDWDFGDGTTFSTSTFSQRNPIHNYTAEGIYSVKLVVYDAKGCKDSAVQQFIFVLPDNNFEVEPTPFCIGQLMSYESPRGLYIDSLIWNFGNGVIAKGGKPEFQTFPPAPQTPQYYYYDGNYTYPPGSEGNTYTVSLKMQYNNNQCIRNYSKSVSIFPAFDVEIDSMVGKQCAGDTIQFFASKHLGSAVTSWDWKFYIQDNTPPYAKVLETSSSVQNPKVSFTKNGNYYATLVAKNADGCEEVIADYGFSVVALPQPYFCVSNPCVEQQTKFFYFCSNFPEISIDSVHWDFGDGAGVSVQEPFHIYADSGLYNVKCEIFNTSFGCRNDSIIPTRIYQLPVPDYTANSVCFGHLVNFEDLSQPSFGDTLLRWSWDFGDGNLFSTTDSTLASPTHMYAATGAYQTSLYVESEISGCVDTVKKTVNVYPNPVAGFSVIENELVSNRPILFTDESTGGVHWLWTFGDGDSAVITNIVDRNPIHTYTGNVSTVTITQEVFNEYECSDTATLRIDLGIYLLLPNAFSPNGDGNNDVFTLVYKGIASLDEFVIFNRWGEKIFDAGGDLKKGWDGKFKGEEQPLGGYVFMVKATTFAGDQRSISGKLTLIR
jgi:gliding motility-associated-like protein